MNRWGVASWGWTKTVGFFISCFSHGQRDGNYLDEDAMKIVEMTQKDLE